MSVKVKSIPNSAKVGGTEWNPDLTWENQTTIDSESYSYTVGINDKASFLDDERGRKVASFKNADGVVLDDDLGDSRS